MTTLQTYKDAGVRTMTVTQNEATAVNPYEDNKCATNDNTFAECCKKESCECDKFEVIATLPSLPTSGIEDGTVSIEEVEEAECCFCCYGTVVVTGSLCQECKATGFVLVKKQVKEEPECPKCLGYGYYSVKTTLRDIPARRACDCKQVKEEEPKEPETEYMSIEEYGLNDTFPCCKCGELDADELGGLCENCWDEQILNEAKREAQEQTAEGVEQKPDSIVKTVNGMNIHLDFWNNSRELIVNVYRDKKQVHANCGNPTDLIAELLDFVYADSQLAQYKAKLIADIRNLSTAEAESEYEKGMDYGIYIAINLIQNG